MKVIGLYFNGVTDIHYSNITSKLFCFLRRKLFLEGLSCNKRKIRERGILFLIIDF